MQYFPILLAASAATLFMTPVQANQSTELAALKKQLADLQKKVDELTTKQTSESNFRIPAGNLAKDPLPQPINTVTNSNKNMTLKLSGQINRMAAYRNNGKTSRIEHLDSAASSSRFNITGEAKLNPDIKAQAVLEMEWLENASSTTKLSYANSEFNTPNSGQDNLRPRKIEGVLSHAKLGTLYIGKGHTATYGASSVDFSGTSAISYGSEGALDLGGFQFYNKSFDITESIIASALIDNYDGYRRADRIRYDTPTLYGFRLGIDHTNQDLTDMALYFNGCIHTTKIAAAFGFVNAPFYSKVNPENQGTLVANELSNLKFRQYTGSFSVLFPVGISFSASGAFRNFHVPTNPQDASRNRGTFWSAKLGYQKNLFEIGDSAMAIEYAQGKAQRADASNTGNNLARISSNFAAINSELVKSYALTFVQNIDRLATELYLTFRLYDFSRQQDYAVGNNIYRSGDFDKAHVIAFGTRIKF